MAFSLNKVTLIGNVGRDPEIRNTNDGKEIISLSLATSESWKDKATGERREKTEWHRIVIFNDALVGIAKKYIKKGSRICVEGSLQTRKWQDASGLEKYTTEVVLQNFGANLILLDAKAQAENSGGEASTTYSGSNFEHSELDDEIPF